MAPLFACLLALPACGQDAPPGQPTIVAGPRSDWPALWSGPGKAFQSMRLLGVVLRQRGGVDFYELALYVDLPGLQRSLGTTPPTEAAVARALCEGRVSHAYLARFVREVGGHARRRFMIEALAKVWPEGVFDENAPEVQDYLDFFSQPLHRGDRSEIWVDGQGDLVLVDGGHPPLRITSDPLCKALVASYMGEPPGDRALRREILRDSPRLLATLGAPFRRPGRKVPVPR